MASLGDGPLFSWYGYVPAPVAAAPAHVTESYHAGPAVATTRVAEGEARDGEPGPAAEDRGMDCWSSIS